VTQADLPLSDPTTKARIARTALGIVLSRRGAKNGIKGGELARLVRAALGLNASVNTVLRRCQEAISAAVSAGEEISATSADGYFVAETAEEIDAGRRDLAHRLGNLAKRYRAYDTATADRILSLLGQLAVPGTTP
jgi:hypothetical protein